MENQKILNRNPKELATSIEKIITMVNKKFKVLPYEEKVKPTVEKTIDFLFEDQLLNESIKFVMLNKKNKKPFSAKEIDATITKFDELFEIEFNTKELEEKTKKEKAELEAKELEEKTKKQKNKKNKEIINLSEEELAVKKRVLERQLKIKEKIKEEEKKLKNEIEQKRKNYLLKFKTDRSKYISKLCKEYNVSYNYIVKLGDFTNISQPRIDVDDIDEDEDDSFND